MTKLNGIPGQPCVLVKQDKEVVFMSCREALPSLQGWEPAKFLCPSKDCWGWGGDKVEGNLTHTCASHV